MTAETILNLLMRWIHIGTVIVLAGGAIFTQFVLHGAASQLPDEHHDNLRSGVLRRWKKIVHTGIALLLISGFYNYFKGMAAHEGLKLYHPLIGTKIFLAMFVFLIASALVGKSEQFAPIRRNRRIWQSILISLIVVIVMISGFTKVVVTHPANVPAKAESDAAPS